MVKRIVTAVAFISALADLRPAAAAAMSGSLDISMFRQGRYVYERNCVPCHGQKGDGNGEMAREIFPKPRSFTSGIFKYKTTPRPFLPTDEDLVRTIQGGIAGTSMPSFSHLSHSDARSVAEYLKSFSSQWRNASNRTNSMVHVEPPGWFRDTAARARAFKAGNELFLKNCAPCHGADADGRGEASPSLKDDWGNPSPAPGLTGPVTRIGRETADLRRVLREGIAGTPMPGYASSLEDREIWELIVWLQDRPSQKR